MLSENRSRFKEIYLQSNLEIRSVDKCTEQIHETWWLTIKRSLM